MMVEGWPIGFAEALMYLKKRGILLAIASKNEETRIREIWPKIFGQRMRLDDFAAVWINWLPKPENMLADFQAASADDPDERMRRIASTLAGIDVGQSVAIAERACVAVEAMEGTDAMLRRAASLVEGKPLRLVKASRLRKHMLFDVPVAGPHTIDIMRETGTTALAIDAARTLLIDRDEILARADAAGIAIASFLPEE